jgi:acetamidase/formamidase
MSSTLVLDDAQPHAFWDRALAPRISIAAGDSVVFETREGTGQVTPETESDALTSLRAELIHPLTGPVFVEGAKPGDTLVVDVVALEHKGWGWNGVIPGFGLLGSEFDEPHIHHYALEGDTCVFGSGIEIPFEPFCGIMGVALDEDGRFDTAPEWWQRRHPSPHSGNPRLSSRPRRRRALLVRRLPRSAGRRGSQRDRHRVADARDAPIRPSKGRRDSRAAIPHARA